MNNCIITLALNGNCLEIIEHLNCIDVFLQREKKHMRIFFFKKKKVERLNKNRKYITNS